MNDPVVQARRFWDSSLPFYLLLVIGVVAMIGLFAARAILPDGREDREARSAALEAQADEAQRAQSISSAAEKARRADLMN